MIIDLSAPPDSKVMLFTYALDEVYSVLLWLRRLSCYFVPPFFPFLDLFYCNWFWFDLYYWMWLSCFLGVESKLCKLSLDWLFSICGDIVWSLTGRWANLSSGDGMDWEPILLPPLPSTFYEITDRWVWCCFFLLWYSSFEMLPKFSYMSGPGVFWFNFYILATGTIYDDFVP